MAFHTWTGQNVPVLPQHLCLEKMSQKLCCWTLSRAVQWNWVKSAELVPATLVFKFDL